MSAVIQFGHSGSCAVGARAYRREYERLSSRAMSAVIQFGHSGLGTVGARAYRREYERLSPRAVSAVIQFGHSGSGAVGARTYRREYRFFVAARGERGDPAWAFGLMRGRHPRLQKRI